MAGQSRFVENVFHLERVCNPKTFLGTPIPERGGKLSNISWDGDPVAKMEIHRFMAACKWQPSFTKADCQPLLEMLNIDVYPKDIQDTIVARLLPKLRSVANRLVAAGVCKRSADGVLAWEPSTQAWVEPDWDGTQVSELVGTEQQKDDDSAFVANEDEGATTTLRQDQSHDNDDDGEASPQQQRTHSTPALAGVLKSPFTTPPKRTPGREVRFQTPADRQITVPSSPPPPPLSSPPPHHRLGTAHIATTVVEDDDIHPRASFLASVLINNMPLDATALAHVQLKAKIANQNLHIAMQRLLSARGLLRDELTTIGGGAGIRCRSQDDVMMAMARIARREEAERVAERKLIDAMAEEVRRSGEMFEIEGLVELVGGVRMGE